MCSHDWAKKFIAGNVKKQKIIDIWLNQKFQFARKKLLSADRNFSPCNKCDVSGELIGKKHANEWNKINEKLVTKIHRLSPDIIDRSKYLRLDKNERVIPFDKELIRFLKKTQLILLICISKYFKNKKLIAKQIKVKEQMIYLSAEVLIFH